MNKIQFLKAFGRDPYTKLLLHMDGTDASTTFTDICGHAFTAYGSAQIDTAQSVFGGASGLFDGDEDYINISAASSDFNMQSSGDWTVDFRIRPATISDYHTIVHFHKSGNAQGLHIYAWGSYIQVDNGIASSGISAGSISLNTWAHIAVIRESNVTKLYINGTLVDSEASQNYGDNDSYCMIGRFYDGASTGEWNGWIDEFRVSKGIARWTENFTSPTSPYSA